MSSEGYDVLRLIEHGKSCYISSEYVYGSVLIRHLKYHPNISKEQLFSWIYEIARQLSLFHSVRGNPCYQYVNPYSIIVSDKEGLYLLDTGAQANQSTVRKMQKKAVRDNFCPPKGQVYQKESEKTDIYGLGRTIQYMLAVTEPEPGLTKREEKRFQKIIARCLDGQSKKSYEDISVILKNIPVYKEKEKKKLKRGTVKKALHLVGVVVICGILWYFATNMENEKDTEKKVETKDIKTTPDEKLLAFDMGMVYLLELEDYGQAAGYLEQSEIKGADAYAMVARCLENGDTKGQALLLEEKLNTAEENIPETRKADCLRGLIKGYAMLDTKFAAGKVESLGESWLQLAESEENVKEEAVLEVTESLASAYEVQEELEKAANLYEDMLQMEGTENKREAFYKKTVLLWESLEEKEKAWECCRQGIREMEDSAELRLLFIRMQCKDPSVSREICAETVKEYIQEMPEITGTEEFRKLQREYDIKMEGEEVWVGK